jgi:hypothetical protein
MLKNRLNELSKNVDSSSNVVVINDSELFNVRGGLKDCGNLRSCDWNSSGCPKLETCGINSGFA